jgi:hypothetical protein
MPLTFRSGLTGPALKPGLCLAALLLASLPPGAHAETAAQPAAPNSSTASPDAPRAGRYTMVPAEGGFVRLDTETGAVSHCRRGDAVSGGVWQCEPIPEPVVGQSPPDTKDDAETAALKREVADLRARLYAIDRRMTAAAPPARPSGDPELDRAMNFSEELMRRFFGLVREFKDDVDQGRI